ncbi:MAG: response regulator, partial [Desulfobulbaceae bacterium]|nr:response regulator [Desulfobulbaceae bacterium]
VVHGIIKQHKGEITVTSEPGQGTTFHIYLPVIEEEVQAEQAVIEDVPQGSERILLVDDETVIAHMMQRILNSLGYTVTVFTRSIEALEAYKKNPGEFDLVITDMTMPEMTGTVLAKKLFALRPDLPVILCTGFNEAIDAEKAKSLGIREYIVKPVNKRTLAKTIRKALGFAQK